MMMTKMMEMIVMETTKMRKRPTVEAKGNDDVWRCEVAATVSKKMSVAKRAKQEIRMKPTNKQIQAKENAARQSHSRWNRRLRHNLAVKRRLSHLCPHVHHIS
jgi:hypothetical protein